MAAIKLPVVPGGNGRPVERSIPEADLVQLAGKIERRVRASRAAKVESPIIAGRRGSRPAGNSAHQDAVAVSGERQAIVDERHVNPFARRKVDANEVHAVGICIHDPQTVAALVYGAADAEEARAIGHDDHLSQRRRQGRGGSAGGLNPGADGLCACPSLASKQLAAAGQRNVIGAAVEGECIPGVGPGRTWTRQKDGARPEEQEEQQDRRHNTQRVSSSQHSRYSWRAGAHVPAASLESEDPASNGADSCYNPRAVPTRVPRREEQPPQSPLYGKKLRGSCQPAPPADPERRPGCARRGPARAPR